MYVRAIWTIIQYGRPFTFSSPIATVNAYVYFFDFHCFCLVFQKRAGF